MLVFQKKTLQAFFAEEILLKFRIEGDNENINEILFVQ